MRRPPATDARRQRTEARRQGTDARRQRTEARRQGSAVTPRRRVVARLAAPLVLAAVGWSSASCSVLGSSGPGHQVSVFSLKVGQCLVPPKKIEADLTDVQVVSCRTPHTQQVYALVRDSGGSSYPTATALDAFANAHCLDRFEGYVGIPYQDSSLYFTYLLPSVRSWAAGDRTVVCVAETVGRPLTASVQGSRI